MIGRLAALIFLSTLSQTRDIPDPIPVTAAEPGHNVTLICSIAKRGAGLFYWYRLRSGYKVQTVVAGTFEKSTLQGQFNCSRFEITNQEDVYFLNIKNVSKDDEATYFCQAGAAYVMEFKNSTVLAVNDQKKTIYIKQSPETATVQPGDSTTLNCSLLFKNKENEDQCPGEDSVYWFRSVSGESPPSIIYIQRSIREKEELRNKERSCTYSLSKTIRNISDTGTYYCAVAACGQILFGEGTKVETREDLRLFVIVFGALLAFCLIVIGALIIARNQKPVCVCGQVTASHHDRSAVDQINHMDAESLALTYAALDFPSGQSTRRMNNRELLQDRMYSSTTEHLRHTPTQVYK